VDGKEELVAKSDPRLQFIPYEEAYTKGFEDMRRRVPDITRISETTGWRPEHSLRKILEDVIEERLMRR
jgi:UDP-glucose 4-epimerase